MKRTDDDTEFAIEFGRELRRKYDEAKNRGVTDGDFANSIGVVRGQLDRYLRGEAVPGIRTVALAFRNHGISVPYGDTALGAALRNRSGRRRSFLQQMELPFTVVSEAPGLVDVKFKPVSARRFALQLTVKRTR